ncbi:MAG: SAM-dependent methyltransferase [Bacteroidota bacterium]
MDQQKRIDTKSSRTAAYTCMCRASSYLEKNEYYKSDDYIAVQLLPNFVKLLLKCRILNLKCGISPAGIYPYVIARTKYIDTIFKDSVRKGFEQVLIMGAGFDSRAIRFNEPGGTNIKVFETDASHTQNAKIRQLRNRGINIPGNNIYIPVDFNKEDLRTSLTDNNFYPNGRTLFILEGLTMYLSHEAINETFEIIYNYSAPGSLVLFDYIYASVMRKELKYYGESAIYHRVKKDNEKWTFGIEEGEINRFLNSHNLTLLEHLGSDSLENKYFRDKSGRLITKVNGTHCIVLAEKKK